MPSPFDLKDRVAFVTGAGRGIGRQTARTLAEAGAHIVAVGQTAEPIDDAAAEISRLGRRSLAVVADVADSGQVNAAVDRALVAFGQIDILVNAAGIARHGASVDTSDDDWRRILDVNLDGTWFCCRAVGRHMLERGSGSIVNIASMSGSIVNVPQPQAAYNSSKAGVIQLTRSLASEWASGGVRVNSVSPGYIATAMTELGLKPHPDWRETWLAMTPMGRLGSPIDVAYAVWYLASDAAAFATGTDLIVDGGYTVR
ncbi:MAG: glucose 1-dehydrogenase [Chloroflexi bacterium]|nr:MAG: glucose 1-dehydrogenase [Chloroflexota bacterium]